MTQQEAIEKLVALQQCGDQEEGHWEADDTLCELLLALGYVQVVEEWRKVGKRYA